MEVHNNGNVMFYDYKKICGLDGTDTCACRAYLHATIKIYVYNSYSQISDVLAVYTTPAPGNFDYEFIECATYSDPSKGSSSFPVDKVRLFGDGYFKVDTGISDGVNTSLLEKLGFTHSVSTRNVWYSNTLHLRGSYRCYH